MATIKQALTAKFQTTRGGDVEERQFQAGETVTVKQTWTERVLVKTSDGHYFNLLKTDVGD